jgi:hypothetical protein
MKDGVLRSMNMQVRKGILCLMMSKGTVMELRMVVVVVAAPAQPHPGHIM